MGWKNIRAHYRIKHIVHVQDGQICIGSPYIPVIIFVDSDGSVRDGEVGHGSNKDLERVWRELTADPQQVRALVEAPDTFAKAMPVYTEEDGSVVVKVCEEPGWPNCTYDGQLMYDNTHFTDRAAAVQNAKENADARVRTMEGRVADVERELEQARGYLAQARAKVAKLDADEPAPLAEEARS